MVTDAIWPIFILTLPGDEARRAPLVQALERLELSYELFFGVDGRQGLPEAFEGRIDRIAAQARIGRPLSDGEFACALSHQMIYEKIVHSNLPGVIILEDDATLSDQFAIFVRGHGFIEADLVLMDHMGARVFYHRKKRWSDCIELIPLGENCSLTTGYSISARGAEYILSKSTPLGGIADWPCDISYISPLVTLPQIVSQPLPDVAQSALEYEREILRRTIVSPVRWKRFGKISYWKRWWVKRRTRRVS